MRTVTVYKWLVWDRQGSERVVEGTEEWVKSCKFKGCIRYSDGTDILVPEVERKRHEV